MHRLQATVLLVLLLTAAIFGQKTESAQSKIESTYSAENNVTRMMLKGIDLPNNKDNFSLGAAFLFEGQKVLHRPCCVTLFINSFSTKGNKYKKNHDLTLWADKEQLRSGPINYDWNLLGTWIQETMWIDIPYQKYMKLANCGKAKAQIGGFKFDLTTEQMQGLRDLADRMNPSEAARPRVR